MTRREFMKKCAAAVWTAAFAVSAARSFADILKNKGRTPNISDKEGRYYRKLAG